MKFETDVLVIGSGTAALAFALKIADTKPVTIITKSKAHHTNSTMAQGGIAAVTSPDDSFSSHINDTLVAGAGLCRKDVVENYIQQAPDRIQDLVAWGVHFKDDLTREGGHSSRRILHFEDHTGEEIHRALLLKVKEHPQIKLCEGIFAIDLITNHFVIPESQEPLKVIGAYALDLDTQEVQIYQAKQVVLASGGAGKAYLYTSNWEGATGDGIAMAFRAGAQIANMEFMQFHPTCLFHRESRNFLISEALRGEGGELLNQNGEAFMKRYDTRGSLAPRDIVARSIDAEMKKSAAPCVYLDMTKHSSEFLSTRFPTIFSKCLSFGIDISKQPIPVVPAAHYLCGGVLTDVNGQSTMQNLWALGETACTGFHGANRLASNSLLECLTMAHNCAEQIKKNPSKETVPLEIPDWIHPTQNDADEMVVISHMWDEIRRLMWNYVGIVRSDKRLQRAQHRLNNIQAEVAEYYSGMKIHPDIIELRNIALVADLTVQCALQRKESRGIHYNLDFPDQIKTEAPKDSVLERIRSGN